MLHTQLDPIVLRLMFRERMDLVFPSVFVFELIYLIGNPFELVPSFHDGLVH